MHQFFRKQFLVSSLLFQIYKNLLDERACPKFFKVYIKVDNLYLIRKGIEQWFSLSLSQYDGDVIAKMLSKIIGL